MIPVIISEKEKDLLVRAKETMDWKVFREVKEDKYIRNKLFFLYQRFVALPMGRMDQVKAIAETSKRMRDAEDNGQKIFEPVVIRTYSKVDKSTLNEHWVEQGGKKITVKFNNIKSEDE